MGSRKEREKGKEYRDGGKIPPREKEDERTGMM